MDHPKKHSLFGLEPIDECGACFKIRDILQRIVGYPAMFPVETMWFSEPLILETRVDPLRMYQEAGNFFSHRVKTDLYNCLLGKL